MTKSNAGLSGGTEMLAARKGTRKQLARLAKLLKPKGGRRVYMADALIVAINEAIERRKS
jgi:hypothetical protein